MPHFKLFSKAGRNIAFVSARPPYGQKEPVAQPVEHLTFNQGVDGSNPSGLTNKIDAAQV
jgi:hypothetical protein